MSFITTKLGQFTYFDRQIEIPTWEGCNVLDFGGNAGNILRDKGCTIDPERYWCVDVSSSAIREGARLHPSAHFVHYDRYNAEFNPTGMHGLSVPPLLEVRFDYILVLSVFTHMPEAEMLELVPALVGRLARGGALAFTFMVPDYKPHGESVASNLEFFLAGGFSRDRPPRADEAGATVGEGHAAERCTLIDNRIYLTTDDLSDRAQKGRRYLTFYRPDYIRSLFPDALLLPPRPSRKTHHCCNIMHLHLPGTVSCLRSTGAP